MRGTIEHGSVFREIILDGIKHFLSLMTEDERTVGKNVVYIFVVIKIGKPCTVSFFHK